MHVMKPTALRGGAVLLLHSQVAVSAVWQGQTLNGILHGNEKDILVYHDHMHKNVFRLSPHLDCPISHLR